MKRQVWIEETELRRALGEAEVPKSLPKAGGRLAVVIGHTAGAPGAAAAKPIGESEYVYNTHLAELIKTNGRQLGVDVKIFTRDLVGIKGCYDLVESWNPDACIELHFNAFNGKVHGTETLYSDDLDQKGVREIEFARLVNEGILKALGPGRSDRGLKERPTTDRERGWFNVNQVTSFASILIEPFFGDNPSEARVASENKELMAREIVKAFISWVKVAEKPATA